MDISQIASVFQTLGIEEAITDNSSLDALGFDSLSKLELVVSLEERFNVSFNDEDLVDENFQTVHSLLALLNKHVPR